MINLLNTSIPIESTNPQGFDYIRQQQNSKELTLPDNGNYIPLTTCLFEAILNEYSKLLPIDIVFFIQLLTLYSSALSKNQKSIIYASDTLAKLLGYRAKEKNNMRSIVLRRVKKLEQLGFLSITRHKNKKGSDEVNEVVPILPDAIYEKIKYESSNFNVDSRRLDNESNIQHILRTKLFTPIDLEFMKSLFDDVNMSNTYKLFCLNCINTAYKNYQTTGALSFSATSQELMIKNNISKRTLFNIFDFIKNQYPDYFIEVEHGYAKSDDIDSNRYDKSTFVISINPIVIPKSFLNKNNIIVAEEIEKTVEKVKYDGTNKISSVINNRTKEPDTYVCFQAGVQKKKPGSAKKEAHNNKDIIIKRNKNIDAKSEELAELDGNNQINPQAFLQTSNSEYLESEQSSLSSKSLKNSIKDFIDALPYPTNVTVEDASRGIKDISERKNKINITNNFNAIIPKKTVSHSKTSNDKQNKELRHFYPLLSKDVDTLNFRTNREFSNNFVNQLLLKLYIKYPEKSFKNKFTFLDYMVKALKNEKHQGPLVNHTTFRFSCNINAEEKNLLEYEKYLIQIENSFDTSKEMLVKKKIAGRFGTKTAYEILTQVEFKTNAHNILITALIPSSLALSERQIEILSQQLEAVYGVNSSYVEIVEDEEEVDVEDVQERLEVGEETSNNSAEDKHTKIKELRNIKTFSKIPTGVPLRAIPTNTVWHQIRAELIEELGEAIYTAWFSKAVAVECKETSTLTLTMPTKFMADWIKSRYGYAISRISGVLGFKFIEYTD